MSIPSENTYENIQREERYKKLERAVKLLNMQLQKKSCDINPLDPPWPSVSSINVDPLDTSCAGFSLHSSRMGSDVLASSRNMHKMMHNRSNPPKIPQGLTTSSIKQSPRTVSQEERVLMPPPKTIGILAHSSRRNSLAGPGYSKSTLQGALGTRQGFSAQSVISSIKGSSSGRDLYPTAFEKENWRDHQPGVEVKPDRIFSKWKPVLNDKGLLIIKGTLDCGKVARSKPVIRRLSSVTVQSIFNHIYHLHGNINDERHELPDYIRGKFYNGFPDDWENVYQVWSNFVADGSRKSFRWPTPVTDSDDDLQSEVSDITIHKPRRRLSPRKQSASIKNRGEELSEATSKMTGSTKLSPRKRLNSSRDRRDRSSEAVQEDKKLLTPRGCLNGSRDLAPGGLSENKSCCCSRETNSKNCEREENNDTIDNFMEKIKNQQMNSSAASLTPSSAGKLGLTSLKDIIQEDKLKIILENLTTRRCSIEYIDKIIAMFDCLKYVVSYQSDDAAETPLPRGPQPSKPCVHRDEVLNSDKTSNPSETSETHHRKRNPPLRRKLSQEDYDSSDGLDESSDNDGRPKLPLRLREKPLDQLRSTEKRRRPIEPPVSESEEEGISPAKKFASTRPQVNGKKCQKTETVKAPERPLVNYDSCVSLTEDERRPLQPPPHLLRPREKTFLRNRGYRAAPYDSSVSSTDDEVGGDSHKQVDTMKHMQKANTKALKLTDAPMKRNFLKENYQKDLPTVPEKTKEETQKDSENKQNLKGSKPLHKDEGIPKIVEEVIEEVSLEITSPEKKKKKPVVVNVEKVSVTLPQLLTKSSSQGSNKDQNTSKKDPNRSKKGSLEDSVELIPADVEDKDLRVELNDVVKESKRSKSSKDSVKKGAFGTETNPKVLTTWFPKLVKKPGGNYGLIFVGKLLNEAGHVASRRFSTDFVLRRVNAQVIETEVHQFYQLTGELCDTKHTVPKEIQKQCLKGCPGKINYFCEKWRRLIEETSPDKRETSHNTTIDVIGVPTSSRGRRILPPLCYWTGERVTLKGNIPVYSPGNSQESSIPSSLEISFRKDANGKDLSQNSSRKKDTSAKDTSASSTLNNTSVRKADKNGKPEDRGGKSKNSPVELEQATKPTRSTSKRRLRRDIKDDSSGPEEVERETRVKRRRARREEGNSPEKGKEVVKSRGRSREDTKGSRREGLKRQTSGLTCTYRTNVPYHDDVLSDDQLSTI
ncbi:enolase-phosphatase E1-like [Diachasmimorpha longicaudata]|uniref:enolase-phosphatase E1-like n=1 Tax=Diachasmimorpha longicaudata TaxID=58733 RepID=UPI0030B91302